MPVSPLVPRDKRQRYLYFSFPCCESNYRLRTVPLEPVWKLYKECGEEVHERVSEFVHQVISKDSEFASTIRDKSLFRQYLHCLSHIKLAEESSDKCNYIFYIVDHYVAISNYYRPSHYICIRLSIPYRIMIVFLCDSN